MNTPSVALILRALHINNDPATAREIARIAKIDTTSENLRDLRDVMYELVNMGVLIEAYPKVFKLNDADIEIA